MPAKIVQEGDPVLRQKAKPVLKKDIGSRKVQGLIGRMSRALAKEGFGVALAAPQVGEPSRLFIIAGKVFAQNEEEKPADPSRQGLALADRVFINPELVRTSKGKKEMTEGCLSVRNKYGSVIRHQKASIRALDEKGQPFIYHGSGLVAQIFQHEVDHLNGILYIDKAIELRDDPDSKAKLATGQAKKKK